MQESQYQARVYSKEFLMYNTVSHVNLVEFVSKALTGMYSSVLVAAL